jgi:hypothetical protein
MKIPQTIWDLTTLSFVVDWVFNVSDTIAAWTPDAYWAPLGNWYTVVKQYCQEVYISGHTQSSSWDNVIVSGCHKTRTRIVRERVIDPARSLLPTCRLQMNWARYIDAFALARPAWGKLLKQMGDLQDAKQRR